MELKNKTILCLGDSITYANEYLEELKRLSGAKEVVNYGVAGTTIAKRKKLLGNRYDEDFLMRLETMQQEADLIVVFGGTNDYGHGDVPIGLETDATLDTFCGNVRILVNKIRQKYKGVPIIFITPTHRINEDDPHGEFGLKPTAMGTLKQYVDALIKVLKLENVNILDLYNDPDFSFDNELFRSYVKADGLHPNDDGHRAIAKKIYEYVKNM